MSTWLHKLRGIELHRLAVLLGTPCSGTKAVKLQGIEDILKATSKNAGGLNENENGVRHRGSGIRLLSIDMGVKNLAYAYFTTTMMATKPMSTHNSVTTSQSSELPLLSRIRLEEWQKFDISTTSSLGQENNDNNHNDEALELQSAEVAAHAYHPALYAGRAHRFVQSVLRHDPTHVVIERQRFRSAGGPAVQEWSIRVGVFEAMLWAVLKTLLEESKTTQSTRATSKLSYQIEGILPARVNQFWFDGKMPAASDTEQAGRKSGNGKAVKLSGKDMKKAKIKLAASMLAYPDEQMQNQPFEVGSTQQVQSQVQAFLHAYGLGRSRTIETPVGKTSPLLPHTPDISMGKVSKLDDLADCFLQGMAWLNWKANRFKVIEHGQHAFDLSRAKD